MKINQLPEPFQTEVIKHLKGVRAKYTEVVSYQGEPDSLHKLVLGTLEHDRYLIIKYFEVTELFQTVVLDSRMLRDIIQYKENGQ